MVPRLVGTCEDPVRIRSEENVNVVGVQQRVAQLSHDVERAVRIRIDQDNARTFDVGPCHEVRKSNVQNCVPCGDQRVAHDPGIWRRIADEYHPTCAALNSAADQGIVVHDSVSVTGTA
jgi:hypothetical protein